ncbi:flagellar protein FliL [Elysia marginata]|uniref:Flagellar protein FliL n=1 Tax=Elysia marginata TaxID=1093978 RepID=A0AAV4HDS1_9GAST|nr:flagellar protein FliL [Elysia marginata]
MNDCCIVSSNRTPVGTSQSNLLSLDHVTTTNNTVKTKPNRRFYRHELLLQSCPKSHNTNTVVNLSHHALTDTQTEVLSKNLNFCPTPKNVNYVELSEDVHRFTRRLRLAEFFYDEETDSKENETTADDKDNQNTDDVTDTTTKAPLPSFLYTTSDFTPFSGRDSNLDTYIDIISKEILTSKPRKTSPNLRTGEKRPLTSLRKTKKISLSNQ